MFKAELKTVQAHSKYASFIDRQMIYTCYGAYQKDLNDMQLKTKRLSTMIQQRDGNLASNES